MAQSNHVAPSNAPEYARWQETETTHIPATEDLKSRTFVQNYYDQINPIDPVTPSENWATKPSRRGFNMSDLDTYIIRDADRLQSSLFDRFILKRHAGGFPARLEQNETLGKLIEDKVGPPDPTFMDIKLKARGYFNGGPMSPDVRKVGLKR